MNGKKVHKKRRFVCSLIRKTCPDTHRLKYLERSEKKNDVSIKRFEITNTTTRKLEEKVLIKGCE